MTYVMLNIYNIMVVLILNGGINMINSGDIRKSNFHILYSSNIIQIFTISDWQILHPF